MSRRLFVTALCALALATPALAQSGEVNVYSYREHKLIQPLLDAFTKDTGIKVNVISASSGLEQRIKTEGANSPADVLLTVDIARLQDAVDAGITQPIKSSVLEKAVAPQYRDPAGNWYGLTMRARVVYAAKERVPQNAIEFSRDTEDEGSVASFFVSLAGTSVGRGWDSVSHAPGTYRSRIKAGWVE